MQLKAWVHNMKKIFSFIIGFFVGLGSIIYGFFLFKKGSETEIKDVHLKAEKAKEDKSEEVFNTSIDDVPDIYLSDDSRDELDRIKDKSENRVNAALGLSPGTAAEVDTGGEEGR